MNILSIETSCDETALSLFNADFTDDHNPQISVYKDLVISQINIHKEYGGVFPALAKREHAKNIPLLLEEILASYALKKDIPNQEIINQKLSELKTLVPKDEVLLGNLLPIILSFEKPNVDAIIVTQGPGLAPALWTGINTAKILSYVWGIPIIPVNHMEGHITSILLKPDYLNQEKALYPLEQFSFPYLSLLISGGHTQIILIKDWGEYEIIGETIDDAVGEAYDKAARSLGMEYPGGPKISQAALVATGNSEISLPRPMLHSGDFRFSFSGLKTAVRYMVEEKKNQGVLDTEMIQNIAKEFEDAVTEVLVSKTKKALEVFGAQGLIVGGGVSANLHIAEAFGKLGTHFDIPVYFPERLMCGDNSLMIGVAGLIQYWKHGDSIFEKDITKLEAQSNMRL